MIRPSTTGIATLAAAIGAVTWIGAAVQAADCNGNSIPDVDERTWARHEVTTLADGPRAVHAADLDGDGDLDVLTASSGDEIVAWHENLNGRGEFGPRRIVKDKGHSTGAVVAPDVDSDGDLDVVWAWKHSWNGPQVAWHENLEGDGTFPGSIGFDGFYPDFRGVSDLFPADLDGDGDSDLLAAWFHEGALVWYRNGSSLWEFAPGDHVVISTDVEQPVSVVAADFDGDGDLDVASASQFDDKVAVYRNLNGAGTFGPQLVLSHPTERKPRSVFAADVNGDGDRDLLVARYVGQVVWYPNLGGFVFGSAQPVATGLIGAHAAVAVDLDGDGDRDVAVATSGAGGIGDASNCCVSGSIGCSDAWCTSNVCMFDGFCCDVAWDSICAGEAKAEPECATGCGAIGGRIVWLENDGLGHFGPPSLLATADGALDVVAADLDSDGDADLLAASLLDDGVFWIENGANDCDADGVLDSCQIASGAADCDGDGILDACEILDGTSLDCNANSVPDACDISDGTSENCPGNSTPDECEPDCNANGEADSCDVAAGTSADLDGDLVPDECEPDCNGNGLPDGGDVSSGSSADCNGNGIPDECEDCDGNGLADACDVVVEFDPHAIAATADLPRNLLVDIEGDGDLDLVTRTGADQRMAWYENLDGKGLFGPARTILAGPDYPRGFAARDFDGDGDRDVVVGWYSSVGAHRIAWYENADGAGGAWTEHVIAVNVYSDALSAADLNGDDIPDILAQPSGTGVIWYRNLGAGSFAAAAPVAGLAVNDFWPVDFDGDGDTDVLLGGDTGLGWAENVGAGTFAAPQMTPSPKKVYVVRASDLDLDGDLDLLANLGEDRTAWFRNGGGGALSAVLFFECPGPYYDCNVFVVRAADLDNDGDDDVLMSSYGFEHVYWYENLDGTDTFGPPVELPGSGQTFDVGDIDGDGDLDVVAGEFGPSMLTWNENRLDDCNADGVPNACEPDCNANGRPDVCDLSAGSSHDCTANGVPDECDVGCSGSCDADGDGCIDGADADPGDPTSCADVDFDLCDDCAGGAFHPAADGPDADGDGRCAMGDCDDADVTTWSEPSPARFLRLAGTPNTQLAWDPPVSPGGTGVVYDVLRAPSPDDFFTSTLCLESNGTDTAAQDATLPGPGAVLHYLVRVESNCPAGVGTMGSASDGTPRVGVACP